MNIESFTRIMLSAIVSGLLTVVAGGNANGQGRDVPLDEVVFTYGKLSAKAVYIKITVDASDARRFLADPVKTLRLRGKVVPQSAEAPWRDFALALRSLAQPQVATPAGRRPASGNEIVYYQVVLRGFTGGVIVAGADVNAVAPPTAGARRGSPNGWFLANPVVTLRAQGVEVPTADEGHWKRLADALKALQLAYANPRVRMDRQSSADSESTIPTRIPVPRAAEKTGEGGKEFDPLPKPVRLVDSRNSETASSNQAVVRIPVPQLAFAGKEAYEANGANLIRYKLSVTNRDSYPDSLWQPSPQLPPCGRNRNAARTWVEIFGSPGDKKLNTFCDLDSPYVLGRLWFAEPAGGDAPPCAYIVMTDRQTGKKYRSDRVCWSNTGGKRPTADAPATKDLATGQQPTFDRRAFEDSLHAAVAPNVMGYTFLLIKDGRVVTEGAGGLARNAADGEMKMTTRTPQNMGSLFKFITGVTVLHLLDRAPAGSAGGNNSFQTRLDAQVTLLYPQLWNSAIKWPMVRSITFRHLLQHRSGFRACSTPLGCFGKRYNNTLFGVREYENINFQLLGFLIPLYTNPELIPALNAVTKTVPEAEGDDHIQMVLSDRMDRFIIQKMFPLAPGNISASCDAENEYKATGAFGYISKSDTGNGIITSRKAGGKPCVGSGGYWMSIRDFGAFAAAALHSDRMLSQPARLEMFRTGMPADDRLVWSSTWADSWIADKFKTPAILWSDGAQPYDGGQGFSTVLLRLPLNYELMVFVNSKGMDSGQLKTAGLKAFRAGLEANFQ
ncbi:MAG: serine hydrolase [Pyrinomonadaceae bacterium]